MKRVGYVGPYCDRLQSYYYGPCIRPQRKDRTVFIPVFVPRICTEFRLSKIGCMSKSRIVKTGVVFLAKIILVRIINRLIS